MAISYDQYLQTTARKVFSDPEVIGIFDKCRCGAKAALHFEERVMVWGDLRVRVMCSQCYRDGFMNHSSPCQSYTREITVDSYQAGRMRVEPIAIIGNVVEQLRKAWNDQFADIREKKMLDELSRRVRPVETVEPVAVKKGGRL